MYEEHQTGKKLLWRVLLLGAVALLIDCAKVHTYITEKNGSLDMGPCMKVIKERPIGNFKEIFYIDTCEDK